MFKYGKKKPQGATRNLPKSNTPTPQAPSNSFLPSWLLVGFGLATGLFLAFVLYLWHPWRPVHKAEAPVVAAPSDTPPKDTTDPRFDFYTLLPSQKVTTPVPDAATPTTTPTPASVKTDTPVTSKNVEKTVTTTKDKTEKTIASKNTDITNKGTKDLHKAQLAKEADAKKAKEELEKDKAAAKAKDIAKKPADANVHYTLQAGSFKSSAEADRRRANIVMSGLPVRVQKVTVKEGEVWYRVVVGPFAGKDKASQARQNLQSDGVDSMMVKQDKK